MYDFETGKTAAEHTLERLEPAAIEGEELATWLGTSEPPQLVAALTPWQFERARIPGSLHFTDVGEALATLRCDAPVVVYCSGDPCPSSRYAARLLTERGYRRVHRLAGGLAHWAAERRPLDGAAA